MMNRISACFVVIIILISLSGCDDSHDGGSLKQAVTFCDDNRWDKAIPLLRHHLRDNYFDGVAHFYLARCYLFDDFPRTTLSRGEFVVALESFALNGGISPVENYSDAEYEALCNVGIARASYIDVRANLHVYGPESFPELRGKLSQSLKFLEKAKEAAPHLDEVSEFDKEIKDFIRMINRGRNVNLEWNLAA